MSDFAKTSWRALGLKAMVAAVLLSSAACRSGEVPVEEEAHSGDASGSSQDHGEHEHAHVHPDEETVRISDEVARRLGVTVVRARREPLERTIRATGEVVWDETRLSTVSLRFGGWVEALHVDFTGRFVQSGEPLLEAYSPELVSAQEDLVSAVRLARDLEGSRVPGSVDRGELTLESSRERLRLWNVAEDEIRRVEETGEVRTALTLEAPFTGYVVEKNVQAGERFERGAALYRLADLSRVWVEAEVYERDIRFVGEGATVEVTSAAHPEDSIEGGVAYVYPGVDRDRRTVRIRVELDNPGERLKPGMYATTRTRVVVAEDAVTVPRDAVMHTGERAVVFVPGPDGQYEIREIRLGAEAGDRVEVTSGLEEGEPVVARSGFIMDAESRLMEAMMGQPEMPGMEMDMDHGDMDMEMDHDEGEMEGMEHDDGVTDPHEGSHREHLHPEGGPDA